jgi:hypothetical protein
VATNNITGKRYIDHWREAGFECETPIKNTGAGAAMMRVEAARRIFPRCWFNEKTTEAGRDALGYYHGFRKRKYLRTNWPSRAGSGAPQAWQFNSRSIVSVPASTLIK